MDIDANLVIDPTSEGVRKAVLEHLDLVAQFTGTDVFLLTPRFADPDAVGANFNGCMESGLNQRLRIAIYGDTESSEHAKTRILIMIDQIVRQCSFLPGNRYADEPHS